MNGKSGVFLKSLVKFSVASWIQAAIALISVPIITRIFSPEEFGKINMFTLSVSILSILVGLAMDQSYVRFFKEYDSDSSRKKMLTQLISICSISYSVCISLIFIFGKSLSEYLFGEFNFLVIYICLPLMILATVVLLYQSLYFRMNENALGYGILSVLTVFSTKIFLVCAALIQPTYTLGILLTVIGTSILVFSYKLFYPQSFEINKLKLNKEQIVTYFKYSLPLLPVAIIVFLNRATIRLLLKDFVSYTALGIFTASITVAGLLQIIESGFRVYWTPFMYSNYKTENALIKKIHSGITLIIISFSLLIILFSDLIFLLLGEEYRSGKSIFALLLIAPVAYTISETTCYGIYINKKTRLQFYCTVFTFIANIIIGLLLIPSLGIFGAAITNAVGGLVFFISRTYYGLKEYNSAEKLSRTFIALGILILCASINYCITDILLRDLLISSLLILLIYIYKDIISKLHQILRNFLEKYKKVD